MSLSLNDRLNTHLRKREIDGNIRLLSHHRGKVDFFSNDYLGLAINPSLHDIVKERYNKIKGKATGATGSRLLSGNTLYYEELESKLAAIFRGESSLIFNSGYTANLAIFSSIPQKGDTIIYDELIHACIKEGSRLSNAHRFSFRHNDTVDLESKLKKATGEKFVALESVYSMDGDFSPLDKVVQLCKRYDANIVLDEAHGTGVFGQSGSGKACELGLEKNIFIRTYTFGKAIGSHGACIVSTDLVRRYLINFARSFIFTTALPLHNLISIEEAFNFIKQNIEIQKELHGRIAFFKESLAKAKVENQAIDFVESCSSIQAIIVSGNKRAKDLSGALIKQGFDVRPILSPTVPQGKERIRICLHVYNSYSEIDELIQTIKRFNF